ncbi:MAG: hypothetical protein CM15mP51_21170 [Porticoccaceae bacterium]|nr:MAG: hypothetical protein CM15mP51_21170 [Porticoccaceae bacterium]
MLKQIYSKLVSLLGKKNAKKRSAPGARVYVTLESSNITKQVLDGLTDDTKAIDRAKIIEDNKKK